MAQGMPHAIEAGVRGHASIERQLWFLVITTSTVDQTNERRSLSSAGRGDPYGIRTRAATLKGS